MVNTMVSNIWPRLGLMMVVLHHPAMKNSSASQPTKHLAIYVGKLSKMVETNNQLL